MFHITASLIQAMFQIAFVMTTCTRAGGRVLRSHPRDAGSGVTSMTGPRAMTRAPAATAPPTTGAARLVRSSRRRKVGEKFVNRQFAWCLLQIGLLTKLDTLNNNNICHQRTDEHWQSGVVLENFIFRMIYRDFASRLTQTFQVLKEYLLLSLIFIKGSLSGKFG